MENDHLYLIYPFKIVIFHIVMWLFSRGYSFRSGWIWWIWWIWWIVAISKRIPSGKQPIDVDWPKIHDALRTMAISYGQAWSWQRLHEVLLFWCFFLSNNQRRYHDLQKYSSFDVDISSFIYIIVISNMYILYIDHTYIYIYTHTCFIYIYISIYPLYKYV